MKAACQSSQTILLQDAQETFDFGARLAQHVTGSPTIFLYGDLGSGKTTFSKGFISARTGEPAEAIASPTFVFVNFYGPDCDRVAHFDLYRLTGSEQFFSKGFDEHLGGSTTALIEWPERVEGKIQWDIAIEFIVDGSMRKATIRGVNLV